MRLLHWPYAKGDSTEGFNQEAKANIQLLSLDAVLAITCSIDKAEMVLLPPRLSSQCLCLWTLKKATRYSCHHDPEMQKSQTGHLCEVCFCGAPAFLLREAAAWESQRCSLARRHNMRMHNVPVTGYQPRQGRLLPPLPADTPGEFVGNAAAESALCFGERCWDAEG